MPHLRQGLLLLALVLPSAVLAREPEICNWTSNGCWFTSLEENNRWALAINCGNGVTTISGTGDIQDPCDAV